MPTHQNKQKSTTGSRKYLVCAALLAFLVCFLPYESQVFGFKFDESVAGSDVVKQALARRRAIEKKFKFHTLERTKFGNSDDNEGDDDDDVSNGKTENDNDNDNGGVADDDDDDDDVVVLKAKKKKNRVQHATHKKYKIGNDDDGDDDDNESRERAAADSGRINEDEEYQFQWARKARKEDEEAQKNNLRAKESRKVKKKAKISKEHDDTDGSSESLLGSLFAKIFGGGKSTSDSREEKQEEELEDSKGEDEDASKSNGIIDWLKWIGEKTGKIKLRPEPEESIFEKGLSYLNRWPFNSLIPFGKPEKPINVPPPRGSPKHSSPSGSNKAVNGDKSGEDVKPMSQEHFDSLLYTLPGFVADASRISNLECKRQIQIFQRQLRGHKLWTMQMLDATGKISSGLLRGNINQFGDFDLCTHIKTLVKVTPEVPIRIRGKYCLVHIETQTDVAELKVPIHLAHGRGLWNSHLGNPGHFIPRYTVANWGVCIPNTCTAEVVREMIESNLRPYNTTGIDFHIDVDDDNCYLRRSRSLPKLLKKDEKIGVFLVAISLLLSLSILALISGYWGAIATLVEGILKISKGESDKEENSESGPHGDEVVAVDPKEESEVPAEESAMEGSATEKALENNSIKCLLKEIFKSFSPKQTLNTLISKERWDTQLPVCHLLKLSATFMLYICLKYLMIGHLPITNRDQLVRAFDQPLSIIFRAPMIYTDTLLLISGFLSSYQLSKEMEQKAYIRLLKRLASKAARYLPTLYLVLLFQTWLLPHLGSGPLWGTLIGENARLCGQQLWRNALSLQNAVDFEESCSPMTIQLALEVQLYVLGPLLVWLYYTDSDAGFFVYGGIQAMSVAARFARTNREHLSMTLFHGIHVSKFYRTANILYSSPISRATPYLLGIGAGILYRSQEDGTFEIASKFLPLGWLLALLGILWCFWYPSSGMRSDFIYTSNDAAVYASWSPLILGLALFWVVCMFPKNENSRLASLYSSRPILFLSRIVFPMQLASYVVVMYKTATVKDSSKYHMSDLVNINEIGLIVLFGIILAFLVDVPCQNIRRLVIRRAFSERPQKEQESEQEQEQEQELELEEGAKNEEDESTVGKVESELTSNETPKASENIWESDHEEEEDKYLNRRQSSTTRVGNFDPSDSSESKLDEKEENDKEVSNVDAEEEEEESDITEEESDITEEDEVKKRPPIKNEEEVSATTTANSRRRRPTTNDD